MSSRREYLAEPEETDLEMKLLAWWQAKESKWLAHAKMVKQYFVAPQPRRRG